MKNAKLLLTFIAVVSCFSFPALAQKVYTPGSGSSMSGGGTFCQGATASQVSFTYNTCTVGSGTSSATSLTVTWYQNTVNSTSGGTVVSTASSSTNMGATGTESYRPSTTNAGTTYYYCVITWTGTGTCNTSGSLTSPSAVAVTVMAPPSAISGLTSVCTGSNITLSDTASGGTWTSSSTGIATIGASTGVVSPVAVGTTTISYTTGCGTAVAMVVSVNASPGAINGTMKVCAGSTTTLTDGVAGGTWSSSSNATATVGLLTGVVTGVTAGTCTINYITGCGIPATKTFTVVAQPGAISGSATVCTGGTTTLSDAPAGGTWASSTTTKALINSSGVVTGVSAGTTTISYTSSGCVSTKVMSVLTTPGAIGGPATVCAGQTITLTDASNGGTWTSANTAIATVTSSPGLVTGVTTGTTLISYSTGCGATVSKAVTVNSSPQSITGSLSVCAGAVGALTDATGGGTWSSSNTAVATMGTTGLITGVANGTSIITYSDGICSARATASVNAVPAAISGTATTCIGSSSALSDAVPMGTWASSNSAVATVTSATGVVYGVGQGTCNIYYNTGCGSQAGISFTVTAAPAAITGTTSVCVGATTTLANTTAGGTWRSVRTSVATVTSGGVVTGVSGDTTTIVYTIGGCYATAQVTVNPLANAGSISGSTSTVCQSSIISLTDAATGGAWSTSNSAVASVDNYGTVLGVSAGTSVISYTVANTCGALSATYTVTAIALPSVSPITSGDTTMCVGASATLNDAVSGGVWSSSNTAVAVIGSGTGLVSAGTAGTATISYTLTNSCGSDAKEITLTSAATSVGSISGTQNVCVGATRTFTVTTSGGAWSSSNTAVATVDATGVITGVAVGTATISYSASSGCSIGTATRSITVNVSPTVSVSAANNYPCSGTSDVLTASGSGGVTYAWSPSTYLSATTGTSVTATPTTSGNMIYTVTATLTSNGCTAAATQTLIVNGYSGSLPWTEGFETYANNAVACNESMPTDGTYGHAATGTVSNVQTYASTDPPDGYTSTSTTIPANTLVNPASTHLAGFGFFANNDFFWTPGFSLNANKTYKFSYYYRTDGNGTNGDYNAWMYANTSQSNVGATVFQSFSVPVTPGNNAALSASNMINFNNTTYRQYTGYFTPAADGTYYFGINARDNNLLLTYYWGFDDMAFDIASNCTAPAAASSVTCSPTTGTNTIISVTASADSFMTVAIPVGSGAPSSSPANGTCYGLGTSLGGGTIIAKGVPSSPMWASTTYLSLGSVYNLYTYTYRHDSCNLVSYGTVSASVPTFSVCGNSAPSAPTISLVSPGSGGLMNVVLTNLPAHSGGSVMVYAWNNALGTVAASPASYSVPSLAATYTVTGVSASSNLWFTVSETRSGCPTNSLVSSQVIFPSLLPWTQNFETSSSQNLANPNSMQGNGGYYTDQSGAVWGEEDNRMTYITPHGGSWDYLLFGGANAGSSYPGTGAPYVPLSIYANQWLMTPGLYCPSAGTYNVSFWYNNTSPAFTSLNLQYSTSSTLPSNSSSTMTGGVTIATLTPTTGSWRQYTTTFNLSSGPQIIYIGINAIANSSTKYMAIDDIEVCQVPTVTATNNSTLAVACNGGTITLAAVTSPTVTAESGAWNYTWTGPGTVTSTGSAGTGSNLSVVGTNPVYSVSVINASDTWSQCSATAITSGSVTPNLPSLSSVTNSGPVCSGNILLLTASGATNVTAYAWTGPVAITNSTSPGANVPVTTTAASGVYSVTVTNGGGSGCSKVYTTTATVNPSPDAGTITGTMSVCTGSATNLTDASTGGAWSSASSSVATVTSGGVVSGVAVGTVTISYAVTNGCGTAYATANTTVNTVPAAGSITGTATVCAGSATNLTDATPGGAWSSSSTSIATVTSAGVVTGVSAGTTTISYAVTNSCGTANATSAVTVNPLPNAGSITGTATVCAGSTTNLTDATAGGAWSSSDNTIATVTSSGVVTGITQGNATISYSVTNSCGTANATAALTVNANPSAGSISGTLAVNAGSTTNLTDAATGGVWSSSDNTIATVTSSGVVTGVGGGVATISYAVTNGCGTAYATAAVTVTAAPNAGSISGAGTVCPAATITLTDAASGGVWSSSSTVIATVTSSGVVTGVASGTATISYTVTNSYGSATATAVVTVSAAPNAGSVSGTTNICPGGTASLTDAVSGGVWSSSDNSIASVSSGGTLTGVTAGSATISYAATSSCGTAYATLNVTVNPLPSGGSVTGTSTVCAGSTTSLTDAISGGAWSSSDNTIATVTSSGVVTGVGQGVAAISYAVTNSCGTAYASANVTVNPVPSAGAISGVTTVCVGSSSTLTDAVAGGVWTSIDPTIASIGSGSGLVSGIAVGTTTISYTVTNSCGTASAATTLITVTSSAPPIAGNTLTCVGSSTTLTNSGTGAWSSSDATIAAVGSSTGVVSGIATGTATITFAVGCGYATTTVTVNSAPPGITGGSAVCVASSTTLNNGIAGGTWSSAGIGTAIVGSSTGTVTGVAAGNTSIMYTTPIGCVVSKTVTVNPLPGAISGITTACAGTSTTLTDPTTGGVWSSSNTSVASIVAGTGFITAITPGSATITYTIGTGCYITTNEAVIVSPLPISGPPNVCLGFQIGLNDAGGGTWSSSNTAVATIGSATGIVSGVSLGTTVITYSLPCGIATKIVTVTPAVPGPTTVTSVSPLVGQASSLVTIIGTNFNTTAANNIVYFGATQATVAAATGTSIVASVPASATYMLVSVENVQCALTGYSEQPFLPTYNNSAYVSGTVNFDNRVDFITGNNPIHVVLGDLDGDGKPEMIVTNNSDNTISVFQNTSTTGTIDASSFATKIDFATGSMPLSSAIGDIDGDGRLDVVVANDVSNTISVLRNTSTIGSISFAPKVDFTTGVNPISIAIGDFDQDGKTDIAVANFYSNTVSIFRNTSASGSINTSSFAPRVDFGTGNHPYSVAISDLDGDNLPDLVVANQADATVSVFRNTSTAGHINSSSFAPRVSFAVGSQPLCVTVADIDGDGKMDIIASNAVSRTISILRNTATSGTITSASFATKVDFASGIMPYKVAVGDIDGDGKPDLVVANLGNTRAGTTTLSVFRNTATSGSITTSSLASRADYLMGNAPRGVAVGDLDGDGKADVAVAEVNDNTISVLRNHPLKPIAGNTVVCGSGSTTTLSDEITGGAWSSSNSSVATVDSASGVVTGVAYGTTTITYSVIGGIATVAVTVNAGTAPVSGAGSVCIGGTLALSDATTGGTWSSSNSTIVNIGSATGVATGLASGTATISYSLSAGCPATATVTVNPAAITGVTSVCAGVVTTLSDANIGGTWTTSSASVATVNASTGDVTGVSAGNATITYTTSAGCVATTMVTVYSTPAAISGTANVCAGATTTLSDANPGGTWSSSNTSVATVGFTGIVVGVSAGTTNVTYSMGTTGCAATAVVTVNPLPSTPTGTTNVCPGTTTTLSGAGGGTWSSSDNTIAVAGSSSGIVTGVSAGSVNINYTLATGCATSISVNVNPLPLGISGSNTVCVGSSTTLSDFGSGTWSTASPAVTVGSASGVVTGVSNGAATVTYTLGTGCSTTTSITVNSLPSAISGSSNVCAGSSVTLSDAGGGSWSSSNASVAAIGSGTGVVTGTAAGTATVSYTLGTGCYTTAGITVNPLPSDITGNLNFCVGTTTTLSDVTTGGTWSSSNLAVATVGASSGVVTGVTAGTSTITYTSAAGCITTATITANALPAPICGSNAFCAGLLRNLSDATGGGTWSSSNTSVATINASTGAVMGLTGGTATITYTLPCGIATTVITVYAPPPGPPTITSMSASSAMPTATVTISGANFNGLPTDNIVYFGATRANVLTASGTSLTVSVPTGATYMPVSVDIVGCALTGYSQYAFMPEFNNSAYIASTVNFDQHINFTTGNNPYSVAIGDIDGDGKADVAVANVGDNTISVFRNTSVAGSLCSASFAAKVDFATGTSPYIVALGDLDGDGKLDMVVTNEVSNTISVFRNTAVSGSITSASFAAKVDFATDVNPISVAIGDIDKDGKADLAVTNFYSNTVSVFRNTGNVGSITSASFASRVTFATDSHPYSVVLADLDGDARVDMAVVNQGAATVSVFRNTATSGSITTASFAAKVNFTTGANPYNIAVGDLDGDGKPEMAIVDNTANTVSVFHNTATAGSITSASFGSKIDFVTGTLPYNVAISDIDGDGRADLVIANSGSNTVSVLRNMTASGPVTSTTFTCKKDFATCSSPKFVAIGDLDGDGKPDLAISCLAANHLCMLHNDPMMPITGTPNVCAGGFTTTVSDGTPGGTWSSSNTAIATVASTGSGVVTGVSSGSAVITYTLQGGYLTTTVNVYALPTSIVGNNLVCESATTTLSDAVTGGTWYSSNTSVATIGLSSGVVSGVTPGNTTITYTNVAGCYITRTVGVNPLPHAGTISGAGMIAIGGSISLTSTAMGGTWSSGNTAVATAGLSTGVVTGVSTGNAVITYSVVNSCGTDNATATVSVTPTGHRQTADPAADPATASDVRLLPNPSKGEFNIMGNLSTTDNADITIEVTNMLGQIVYNAKSVAYDGKLNEHISLNSSMVNGMYTVTMHSVTDTKIFHLVIER